MNRRLLAIALLLQVGSASSASNVALDIKSQPTTDALRAFVDQTGLQLLFPENQNLHEAIAPAVVGSFSPDSALNALVANSGLRAQFINQRTLALRADSKQSADINPDVQLAQADVEAADASGESQGPSQRSRSVTNGGGEKRNSLTSSGLPDVLVIGSRSLNVDIPRTVDDITPVAVISRRRISDSGATNVEELLKSQLTMNYSPSSYVQAALSGLGNESEIALRGLSSKQTLILVDGRRASSTTRRGEEGQPDINGIPLAAIERIEVLPIAASGIYGGSATGGVVNVILRRDYSGLETRLYFENGSSNAGGSRRVEFGAGKSFADGRTSLMVNGSFSKSNPLYLRDRPYIDERHRQVEALNEDMRPGGALPIEQRDPPLARTANIQTTSTRRFVPLGTPGATCFGRFCFIDERPNLTLKNTNESLNSPITFVPLGYAGPSADGGRSLLANAGEYNFERANTSQIRQSFESLLGEPTVSSLSGILRHRFSPSAEVFLELTASNNFSQFDNSAVPFGIVLPPSSSASPFNEEIFVSTPAFGGRSTYDTRSQVRRALIGTILKLPREWSAEFDLAIDRADARQTYPNQTLDPAFEALIRDGNVELLRDTEEFPLDMSAAWLPAVSIQPTHSLLTDATIHLAGPLGNLPAGRPVLATMLEYRKQTFSEYSEFFPSPPPQDPTELRYTTREDLTSSASAELQLPVISERNSLLGVRAVDLQLAVRYDRYDRTGGGLTVDSGAIDPHPEATFSSVDRVLGLRYQPIPDVTFRTSYSTGFLPPALNTLPTLPLILVPSDGTLQDPLRDDEIVGDVNLAIGGSPELEPETSTTRSAGVVLTPRFIDNLRLSFDWVKIDKRNNIVQLGLSQQNIDLEEFVPDLVVRGAPDLGFAVGPIVGFNSRYLNVTRSGTESIDISLDYVFPEIRYGSFELSVRGTRLIHVSEQLQPAAPVSERLSTIRAPKWNGYANLSWSKGDLRMGWTARFLDSYFVRTDFEFEPLQQSDRVRSTTIHDVFASYRLGSTSRRIGFASSMELMIGAKNVFNEEPRFNVRAGNNSDPWVSPLMFSYYASLRMSF